MLNSTPKLFFVSSFVKSNNHEQSLSSTRRS
jgi:hypothetical protein